MPIICDTNALLFDALAPQRLTQTAREALQRGEAKGLLACSDISLWEIAMLLKKGRLRVDREPETFLWAVLAARRIQVLPINADIAALSQADVFPHDDPADRLIGATAMHHGAPLVTSDRRLHGIPGLEILW